MSSAHRLLPHYTYNDYVRWEGAWELVEGLPYAMSPLPTVRHQDLSGNLYLLFRKGLKKAACSCKVFLPIDYKVSDDTVLQPDLLITCKDILGQKFITERPELVVEVLSSSTAMKDLNTKFLIYQEQGVPYYLIVDPEKETLEIHELQNGIYQRRFSGAEGSFEFKLGGHCVIALDIADIWE